MARPASRLLKASRAVSCLCRCLGAAAAFPLSLFCELVASQCEHGVLSPISDHLELVLEGEHQRRSPGGRSATPVEDADSSPTWAIGSKFSVLTC